MYPTNVLVADFDSVKSFIRTVRASAYEEGFGAGMTKGVYQALRGDRGAGAGRRHEGMDGVQGVTESVTR